LSKEEIEHNSQKDAEEGLTALHVNWSVKPYDFVWPLHFMSRRKFVDLHLIASMRQKNFEQMYYFTQRWMADVFICMVNGQSWRFDFERLKPSANTHDLHLMYLIYINISTSRFTSAFHVRLKE
jgi:hypothetical protein